MGRVGPGAQATRHGTVTNAATGLPVADAEITFWTSVGDYAGNTITDAQTAALSAGQYFVRAGTKRDSGLLGEVFDNVPCAFGCDVRSGTPVTVTGSAIAHADFALSPGARITGTVTSSATGRPVANLSVNFFTIRGRVISAKRLPLRGGSGDTAVPAIR